MTETRTYGIYSIRWNKGSVWSGYQTRQEAEAVLNRGDNLGQVMERTFSVDVPKGKAHLYR
jgi:hypothetical protein